MKNKIRKSVFVGVFLITLCSSVAKADDAFVVEEEAVIRTQEPVTEVAPPAPVQTPPIPVEEIQKEPQKREQWEEPEKQEEKEIPEETEEGEAQTISQNAVAPVFQVPVRRKIITRKKEPSKDEDQTELQEPEVTPELSQEQEEGNEQSQKSVPVWPLAVSGIFLLAGIAGIVHRLLIRYGKL